VWKFGMSEITQLLRAATQRDPKVNARLFELVYEDLRRLAASKMGQESPRHTLQATALVHEVYLKLVVEERPNWKTRGHFYAAAALAMRRILVDSARRRKAAKRGAGGAREELREDMADGRQREAADVLAIDEALGRLGALDRRLCDIVNLRVYVGMTIEETARALGVTSRTVNREWLVAKAWLAKELGMEPVIEGPRELAAADLAE
jgi:RNA polymerase sigma factor (TIGR02999 family)